MASIPFAVPTDGSEATLGPIPFVPKGMTLINSTGKALSVTDDRGIVFTAQPFTIVTVQPNDSHYLRAKLAAGVTIAGQSATVYVSSVLLPITSSGLAAVGSSTLQFQQNGALVATEPILDVVDSDVTWVVVDDAPNTRTKLSGIISLISRALKISAAGNNQLTLDASDGAASVVKFTTTDANAANRNWAFRNRYSALGQFELVVGTAQGTDPNLGNNVIQFDSAGFATLFNTLRLNGSQATGKLPMVQLVDTVTAKTFSTWIANDGVTRMEYTGILGSILTLQSNGLVQINSLTAQRTSDGLGAHMERGAAVTDGSGNVSVSFTSAFSSSVSVTTDVLNADARSNAHLTGVGVSNFQAHAEVIGAGSIAGVNLFWIAAGV